MNIAMLQADLLWEDVTGNLQRFEKKLAAIRGADMIVLPEMFASGFTMEGKEAVAARYDEIEAWLRARAAERDALVMGSTACRVDDRYYNRLVAAFPDGTTLYYDKRHCFTMGGERAHFSGGRERLTFTFRGVRVAAFICYDLRFPVWSRNTDGYEVAVYVANWPRSRRDAWRTLLQARAIENQCYVVGVNRVGEDGQGIVYSGDSVLVSPRGELYAACYPGREWTRQTEVDMEALRDFRRRFPVLEDRDEFKIM